MDGRMEGSSNKQLIQWRNNRHYWHHLLGRMSHPTGTVINFLRVHCTTWMLRCFLTTPSFILWNEISTCDGAMRPQYSIRTADEGALALWKCAAPECEGCWTHSPDRVSFQIQLSKGEALHCFISTTTLGHQKLELCRALCQVRPLRLWKVLISVQVCYCFCWCDNFQTFGAPPPSPGARRPLLLLGLKWQSLIE